MDGDTPRRKRRRPGRHGMHAVGTLTRAASLAKVDAFDMRTSAGRFLYDSRQELEAHLGGESEMSTTERWLAERVVMRRFVLSIADETYKRTLREGTPRDQLETAQKIAALERGFVAMLDKLGWRPRAKDVSLVEQIAALHREQEAVRRATEPTERVVSGEEREAQKGP